MNNLMTTNIDDLKQLNKLSVDIVSPKTDISIHDGVISAQRVAVKRNEEEIMRKIEIWARVNGPRYYYRWDANDKSSKTGKSRIEGPTVKMAMDIVRLYGNNQNDIRVVDNGDHWIFYARFVDLETGYSLTKAFQQRKSQATFNTKDAGKQMDVAFQIGQSKAQRNVIVAALSTFVDFAMECSKSILSQKVAEKPQEFLEAIKVKVQELGFDFKRIEANIGLDAVQWNNTIIAKVWAEIQTISDGAATFDDVYPIKKETTIENKPKTLDALKDKFATHAPELLARKEEPIVKEEPVIVKPEQKANPTIKSWMKLVNDIKATLNKAKTSDEIDKLINTTNKITLDDMKKEQPDFYNQVMDYAMDMQSALAQTP